MKSYFTKLNFALNMHFNGKVKCIQFFKNLQYKDKIKPPAFKISMKNLD